MPSATALPVKYTRSNRPDRIINYRALNKAYVDRGRLETWVDPSLFQKPGRIKGRNGRPVEYTDGLVQMLLLLKIRFNLPYRALEGFALSLFQMVSADARKSIPSFGTTAQRVRGLGRNQEALLRTLKAMARSNDDGRPKQILIDSTGISTSTMGPWRATRPWTSTVDRQKRQFVKLHIGVNPATGMIEAAIVTPANRHDSQLLEPLIEEINPDRVSSVVADGAYHDRKIYRYLTDRGIRDIRIPPRKNTNLWKQGSGASLHNQAVFSIWTSSKKEYKKQTGYHVRSLVESTMHQIQKLTSSRVKSKSTQGINAEILAACIVLNKQTSLGRAEYNARVWKSHLSP